MTKIRDGNLPTGKGTFIWLLPRLIDQFGSMGALVDQLVEDGYQWVTIKAQHGYLLGISSSYSSRDRHIALLDEFCPLAEASGIEVHGWGYNYGNTSTWRKITNQQQKETNRIVEAMVRWRFRSWLLNAESEFKVKGGNTAAVNLTNLVRETLETHPERVNVPIGISSYRFPSSHNTWAGGYGFPFWGFLQGCDFSNPQVYWQKKSNSVEQLEKSVKEWNEIVELPIVAAGTIYPEGDWRPTGEQVMLFNERCKEMPEVIATCYWEHWYPFKYNYTDIISVLAAFDWQSTGEDSQVEPEPEPNGLFDCEAEIEDIKRRLDILENK